MWDPHPAGVGRLQLLKVVFFAKYCTPSRPGVGPGGRGPFLHPAIDPKEGPPNAMIRNVQSANIPVGVPSISLDMYTGLIPQQPIILPTQWPRPATASRATRTLFLSGVQPYYDLSMLKFHFPMGSWFCLKDQHQHGKAGAALTETSFR